MIFSVKAKNENIIRLARKIGYRISEFDTQRQEYNLVCPVGGRYYPRFHIYLKRDGKTKNLCFNLHLDHKKPSYKGAAHAHSGEYEGKLIEVEVKRIETILA